MSCRGAIRVFTGLAEEQVIGPRLKNGLIVHMIGNRTWQANDCILHGSQVRAAHDSEFAGEILAVGGARQCVKRVGNPDFQIGGR